MNTYIAKKGVEQLQKFVIIFIILSFATCGITQDSSKTNINPMLKNWVVAQVGEMTGFALTGLSYRFLEGIDAVNFDSNNQRNKYAIISGIVIGHVASNFFLKKPAKQNSKEFLFNNLFSSIPTIFYSLAVKPEFNDKKFFWRKYDEEFGLVLVELFLSPMFSTLGAEIFSSEKTSAKNNTVMQINPHILKDMNGFSINLTLKF